jgi:iron complex transport system substrate-binding protein
MKDPWIRLVGLLLLAILPISLAAAEIGKDGGKFRRIISLGPSLTESLYVLGVGGDIVGVTDRCRKPPEARLKEKVGSVVEVNVEKITSLKPDLILATSLTQPRSVEKLKKLGLPVTLFQASTSFLGLGRQFLELGRLVGKEKESLSILTQVEKEMQDIRRSLVGKKRPRVIIQAGANPLWIAPRQSFLNDFIELAGGENVGPQGTNGRFSREKVLESRPEVILITTMGLIGEKEREIWKKYPSLPAVIQDRIYIIESDRFCSPTVVSFVKTLKEIIPLIHGKG